MNRISVLVSARKNSKYLAKFIQGYQIRTSRESDIELLVMLNDEDTWNDELVNYYNDFQDALNELVELKPYPMRFYREDLKLGRGGLHRYYNDLLGRATGDWFVYFCEDHFITMPNWDEHIRDHINGKKRSGDRDRKSTR